MEFMADEAALGEVPIPFTAVGVAAASFLFASGGADGEDVIAAAVNGSSAAWRGTRPLRRLLELIGEMPGIPPTLAGVALRPYFAYSHLEELWPKNRRRRTLPWAQRARLNEPPLPLPWDR
jgi:hypothetical protein